MACVLQVQASRPFRPLPPLYYLPPCQADGGFACEKVVIIKICIARRRRIFLPVVAGSARDFYRRRFDLLLENLSSYLPSVQVITNQVTVASSHKRQARGHKHVAKNIAHAHQRSFQCSSPVQRFDTPVSGCASSNCGWQRFRLLLRLAK